jgi:roadblock/LC7 domain-containing protein
MKEDSWNAISTDGRIVKYAYKELSDGIASISAKVSGRFLMMLQRSISAPLTRKQVEAVFEQNHRVAPLVLP